MPTTVWQIVSSLVGGKKAHHGLQTLNCIAYSTECKAEIFAGTIEEQLQLTEAS